MQVKMIYEPVQPADLLASNSIAVLPIFVTEEQFHQAQVSTEYLQELARAFIGKSGVSYLRVPALLSVLLLAVRPKHNKKKILRKAELLYSNCINPNDDHFITELPGLCAADVLPFGGMNAPIYRFWNSNRGIVVSTGDAECDSLLREFLRTPTMVKYTPVSMQHPSVAFAFEVAVHTYCQSVGFDIALTAVNQYRNLTFVSAEVFPLEGAHYGE